MKQVSPTIKTAFFTVLFLFVFLYLFTQLFGPIPFSVNSITTMKNDSFSVSGEGEASAIPDTAVVNLGVTKNARTAELAKNQMNEITNAIVKEVKNMDIPDKDIKTNGFYINPEYDYTNGAQRIVSYTATQNIQVKVTPIDKANQVIDKATAKGANAIPGIEFTLNDEKRAELEKQAREEAIKKAKAKAEELASLSGVRLGKVINVYEDNSSNLPRPMYDMKMANESEAVSPETDLQPGENTIHLTVTLSYETL